MLDMGFIPDIERIAKLLPPRRQTLFFSATMPPVIQRLVKQFLRDPVRIEASPPSTAAGTITQRALFVSAEPAEKREALRQLIREQGEALKNAIIFCNRKRDVAILHRSLLKHGFNAGALHGDMNQHERMATLEAFRNGEIALLAASDVAARGLDIPEVSHVFNFDVPVHAEDYVHRIGRTGRAGRKGFAATLVTADDMKMLAEIEALTKQPIAWIGEPPDEEALSEGRARRRGRGRGGASRGGRNAARAERKDAVQARRPRRRGGRGRSESASKAPAPAKGDPPAAARSEASPKAEAAPKTDAPARSRSRTRRPAERGTASAKPRPVSPASREDAAGRRASAPAKEAKPAAKKKGAPVRGLGSHVPEFLKRPVRNEG